MSSFFALLALAACAVAAVLLVSRAVSLAPAGRWWWERVGRSVGPQALPLAWLVAAVSTAGSLYYSEAAGLVPCELCWYQRIAMYPLVVVLGIAALRRDFSIRFYVLPLSLIGLSISSYHYWLQLNPGQGADFCTAGVPCSAMLVSEFGFISIPFMAGCGFAAITALLLTTGVTASSKGQM
ncbi:MAG: disulfide oxidoreductase [Actinomycetota bacterium]